MRSDTPSLNRTWLLLAVLVVALVLLFERTLDYQRSVMAATDPPVAGTSSTAGRIGDVPAVPSGERAADGGVLGEDIVTAGKLAGGVGAAAGPGGTEAPTGEARSTPAPAPDPPLGSASSAVTPSVAPSVTISGAASIPVPTLPRRPDPDPDMPDPDGPVPASASGTAPDPLPTSLPGQITASDAPPVRTPSPTPVRTSGADSDASPVPSAAPAASATAETADATDTAAVETADATDTAAVETADATDTAAVETADVTDTAAGDATGTTEPAAVASRRTTAAEDLEAMRLLLAEAAALDVASDSPEQGADWRDRDVAALAELSDAIRFRRDSAVPDERTEEILDSVAAVLTRRPEAPVTVEVRGAEQADARRDRVLRRERGRAIIAALVERDLAFARFSIDVPDDGTGPSGSHRIRIDVGR